MNDKFDKKLTKLFREKFQHFSEPYNAENWARLEQHIYFLKRRRVLKYTMGIAASLGLAVLIIILLTVYPEHHTTSTISKNIPKESRELSSTSLPASDTNESGIQHMEKSAENKLTLSENTFNLHPEFDIKEHINSKPIASITKNRLQMKKTGQVKSVTHILADQRYIQTASSKKKSQIKFGFVFSPQVHQIKNDYSSEINFAGGISSEFPLFSQVKLNMGVLLSQQTFGFESDIQPALESRNIWEGDQCKKTEARLLALDIPVNLKYDLMDNPESNIFITVGISSLAYFQEKYNDTYYTENSVDVYEESKRIITVYREEETSVEAFDRFDLAKILNVSLGMGYKFRNDMEVQIEPFLKYPLGSITSENIKIGSGGIQFRIYF